MRRGSVDGGAAGDSRPSLLGVMPAAPELGVDIILAAGDESRRRRREGEPILIGGFGDFLGGGSNAGPSSTRLLSVAATLPCDERLPASAELASPSLAIRMPSASLIKFAMSDSRLRASGDTESDLRIMAPARDVGGVPAMTGEAALTGLLPCGRAGVHGASLCSRAMDLLTSSAMSGSSGELGPP